MPPSQVHEHGANSDASEPPAGDAWRGGPPWSGPWSPVARRGGRRRGFGPWFPIIVSLILQLPVIGITRDRPWFLILAGLGFAASFALLARRRHPAATVVAIAALCLPAIALGVGPPLSAIPLAFAVVLGIVRGARPWVWSSLAGLAIAGPLLAFLVAGSSFAVIRPLMVALGLCLLVGIGEAMRNRRERFRQISRDASARRQSAAEAERVRIARELHDVLAHSLSQISVQAGVGLHLFDAQPEQARESLAVIKATSAQALEEVRGVLGVLRAEGESAARAPGPDLARLPALVESFRGGGVRIELTDQRASPVPAAIQQAAYRIVQESLTNIARHAHATTVAVDLADLDGALVVTVTDNGRGAPASAAPGGGLLGMRERAELLGGSLVSGSIDDGGFRVQARIPLPARAAETGEEAE